MKSIWSATDSASIKFPRSETTIRVVTWSANDRYNLFYFSRNFLSINAEKCVLNFRTDHYRNLVLVITLMEFVYFIETRLFEVI